MNYNFHSGLGDLLTYSGFIICALSPFFFFNADIIISRTASLKFQLVLVNRKSLWSALKVFLKFLKIYWASMSVP